MSPFTIFFLVAVAIVSPEASAWNYYCDAGTKTCFLNELGAPVQTDETCEKHRDCYVHRLEVKGFCNPGTKTCFTREFKPPMPTGWYCETPKDCYLRLVRIN